MNRRDGPPVSRDHPSRVRWTAPEWRLTSGRTSAASLGGADMFPLFCGAGAMRDDLGTIFGHACKPLVDLPASEQEPWIWLPFIAQALANCQQTARCWKCGRPARPTSASAPVFERTDGHVRSSCHDGRTARISQKEDKAFAPLIPSSRTLPDIAHWHRRKISTPHCGRGAD